MFSWTCGGFYPHSLSTQPWKPVSVFPLLAIEIVLLFTCASRSPSCSCTLVVKYMSKSCSHAVGLPGDQALPLEAWLQWEACQEERIWDCLCLALSLIRVKIVRVHWLFSVALIINWPLYFAVDSKKLVFVCSGVKEDFDSVLSLGPVCLFIQGFASSLLRHSFPHRTLERQLFKCAKPDPSAWVALPVQSLSLLTSIILSKMCSKECSVLKMVNSGPVLLFCVLLSRAGWLSCVFLVFLFLFFLYILDLEQGFVERDVPHAVPSCCYLTKQMKARGGMKGRRAACTWHICALPVESSVESLLQGRSVSNPAACMDWRVSLRSVTFLAPENNAAKLWELLEFSSVCLLFLLSPWPVLVPLCTFLRATRKWRGSLSALVQPMTYH